VSPISNEGVSMIKEYNLRHYDKIHKDRFCHVEVKIKVK